MTFISICHIYQQSFTIVGEMTDADKRMNPLHFGNDPADIRIRMQINPKIRIRISDHICLKFWPWRRFALSKHILVTIYFGFRFTNK